MKKFLFHFVLILACLCSMPQEVSAARFLIPVGEVIGLEVGSGSVTVAAFDEELGCDAKAAGLSVGDEILAIDGKKIGCAEDIRAALQRSDGRVDLQILRNGQTRKLHIAPQVTPDGPRLGIFLRQGITGIGTVTYYDPADGSFGALGHGVNDNNGQLLQLTQGSIYPASVASVRKGRSGEPGQLMGTLAGREKLGTLSRNAPQGVFGKTETGWKGQALPAAQAEQIHTGSAIIRSTIAENTVQEYSVEILKIYPSSRQTGRNMLIRVTDPALLDATGGIVQGMSGSPIIQDGHLIGAVTHVLVNDPTTGYGIFIENMLDAAA